MMKRLGVYFLMILFLQSKIGLAFNVHYCGTHIAKISWAFDAKGCGMEKEMPISDALQFSQQNCCDDDTIIAQNDSDQTTVNANQIPLNGIFISPPSFITYNNLKAKKKVQFVCRPPPRQALYKFNGAFLFYG